MGHIDAASKVDDACRRPVALDVFSGAGGMSLGFEQAGFDVLAAVDNDPVHLAVHERNFPYSQPICADVGRVTAEEVAAAVRKGWALAGRVGEWDGVVDCLIGGPTCQGFSDMGRQAPDDERNNLIFAFARLVRELRPRSFVMENVPGLLFGKVRERLNALQAELTEAGYTLQSSLPILLDASDYGVPQKRRRVFIVGVADNLEVPDQPAKDPGPTVAEALDDLPNVDDIESLLQADALRLSASIRERLETRASAYVSSLRGPYGLEHPRNWEASLLTGCKRTCHTDSVKARFARLAAGSEDGPSRTRRLAGEGHSFTLRAGTGRDHGSYTAPRPVHHVHHRVITVREAARLHTFPDWFDFHTRKWHALREIGNAVPPRLAAAIGRTIVEALGYEPDTPPEVLQLGPESLLQMSMHQAADHYSYDRALLPVDVRRAGAKA